MGRPVPEGTRTAHAGVGGINDPTVSIDYQWFRNDKKIRGASARAADYRLRRADRGKWIWAEITVSKPGYQSVTARAGASGSAAREATR